MKIFGEAGSRGLRISCNHSRNLLPQGSSHLFRISFDISIRNWSNSYTDKWWMEYCDHMGPYLRSTPIISQCHPLHGTVSKSHADSDNKQAIQTQGHEASRTTRSITYFFHPVPSVPLMILLIGQPIEGPYHNVIPDNEKDLQNHCAFY